MSQPPAMAPFEPVERIGGRAAAGVLFLCDHARNALPAAYGDLGLAPAQFERHIAYDIGAAAMTRRLAAAFDAPALLTTYSRLLIDPNRGADDPTLVMRLSDGAIVPGNARVDAAEVERRRRAYWQPYRDAIRAELDAMLVSGVAPAIVAVHSFTPAWKGVPRPWSVGVLWDRDDRLARPVIDALRAEPDLAGAEAVGDNEPYDGALEGDTMDEAATERGLAPLLVEVRQDLVADEAGAHAWADRLARLLRPVLAREDAHIVRRYGSRTRPDERGTP